MTYFILMLCLAVAVISGLIALILSVILFRTIKAYKNQKEEVATILRDLDTFVFDNAVFMDNEGKSETPYDSKQVQEKWDKYNNLINNMCDILEKR